MATAKIEVEILTKRLIKPSIPTPNHLRKLKLSLFDQLAPKIYVDIIYYYSGSSPDGEIIPAGNITARRCAGLEKSLSEALVHWYPFAGRFIKDDVSLDCSDQGVEFWQARVLSCTLSEFLKRAPDEIELADPLLPWSVPPAVDSETSPQLAIQVNAFDDGGIVVGVRISHILADAATWSLLMKTWADACRDGLNNRTRIRTRIPSFHHEIARVFPADSSSAAGFRHPVNKIVTRRFLISSKLLAAFKNTAVGKRQPSRVVAALALVWKSLIGVSIAKNGEIKDSALSIPMNLRRKLSLETKKSQKPFGNFFVSIVVSFPAENRAATANNNDIDLLSDLITLLSDKISDASAKAAGASRDELVAMMMNSRKDVAAKWNRGVDVYFCSSWFGTLPVYETDFGWGYPKWASICTQPGSGVCLMDSCEEDGMEVWVSLKQAEMASFKREFYSFESISNL